MATIAFLVRTGLRRRVVAFITLAVLVGIAGGASMAAWAGARRTATAYPRLLDYTDDADVQITSFGIEPIDVDAVRAAPGVRTVGALRGYGTGLRTEEGIDFDGGFFSIAPTDEVPGRLINRPIIIEGRLPDPHEPDEVLISRDTVAAGFHIGSTIPVCVYNFAEAQEQFEGVDREPTPEELARLCPSVDLEVVGIGRFPFEINADENEAEDPLVLFSPAFARTVKKAHSYDIVSVDLADPDRDFRAFQRAVLTAHPGGQLTIEQRELGVKSIELAVQPYVTTLNLFAVVLALASLGVLLPAVRRAVVDEHTTAVAMAATGVTTRQRWLADTVRGGMIGLAGAATAAAIAIAASSAFPIGTARLAEPHPGTDVDFLVIAVGASAVFVASAAVGATSSRRRRRHAAPRTSTVVSHAVRLGAPPTAILGMNAAIAPRTETGRSSTAPALVGTVVSIVAVAAALSFGASLTRMLDEPARYGWTWDAALEAFEGGLGDDLEAALESSDSVDQMSVVYRATVTFDDQTVVSYAFDPRKGDVSPAMLDGRYPADVDEVALGGQTLDRLDRSVGDEITAIDDRGDEHGLRIVGRTLVPSLALGQRIGVGEGAVLSREGLAALADPEPGLALLDLAPGVTPASHRAELIEAGFPDPGGLTGPTKTGDLVSYERVDQTPLFLAGLLALLGAGVLAHSLVASIRGRRRELAVLKCIGFGGRQVAATVGWHATTLVIACLAIGLPLGVAAGQVAWRTFADRLGVPTDAALPLVQLTLLTVGALVVANLVAAGPGLVARRIPPAVVLRQE